MRAFTVKWSDEKDVTAVNFTPEFQNAHQVTKLDILEDAIYLLQKEHDQIMNLDAPKKINIEWAEK